MIEFSASPFALVHRRPNVFASIHLHQFSLAPTVTDPIADPKKTGYRPRYRQPALTALEFFDETSKNSHLHHHPH